MEMQVVAWLAAALVFVTFFMKTIIPLRTAAIASNVVFIVYGLMGLSYGIFDKVLPILVLHIALVPLNILRLRQVLATIEKYRNIGNQTTSLDILIPHMKHEIAKAGTILFKAGDAADKVYLVGKGRVSFPEVGKVLGEGKFFGEVGVFSEQRCRTASAVCEEECELLSITGEKVIELFYQDSRFALIIVRAISRYLLETAPTDIKSVQPGESTVS